MSAGRLKLSLIIGGVLAAALALLSWTQRWFAPVLPDGRALDVSGQQAAPALSALALASLALVGALAIASRGIRTVLGLVQALLGLLVVVTALVAIVDPVGASAKAITDATAVSGPESIAALVQSISADAWPWLAVLAGVLALVVGIAVVVTARRWPGPTRKYEAAAADEGTAGAWDSLSKGDDPTDSAR